MSSLGAAFQESILEEATPIRDLAISGGDSFFHEVLAPAYYKRILATANAPERAPHSSRVEEEQQEASRPVSRLWPFRRKSKKSVVADAKPSDSETSDAIPGVSFTLDEVDEFAEDAGLQRFLIKANDGSLVVDELDDQLRRVSLLENHASQQRERRKSTVKGLLKQFLARQEDLISVGKLENALWRERKTHEQHKLDRKIAESAMVYYHTVEKHQQSHVARIQSEMNAVSRCKMVLELVYSLRELGVQLEAESRGFVKLDAMPLEDARMAFLRSSLYTCTTIDGFPLRILAAQRLENRLLATCRDNLLHTLGTANEGASDRGPQIASGMFLAVDASSLPKIVSFGFDNLNEGEEELLFPHWRQQFFKEGADGQNGKHATAKDKIRRLEHISWDEPLHLCRTLQGCLDTWKYSRGLQGMASPPSLASSVPKDSEFPMVVVMCHVVVANLLFDPEIRSLAEAESMFQEHDAVYNPTTQSMFMRSPAACFPEAVIVLETGSKKGSTTEEILKAGLHSAGFEELQTVSESNDDRRNGDDNSESDNASSDSDADSNAMPSSRASTASKKTRKEQGPLTPYATARLTNSRRGSRSSSAGNSAPSSPRRGKSASARHILAPGKRKCVKFDSQFGELVEKVEVNKTLRNVQDHLKTFQRGMESYESDLSQSVASTIHGTMIAPLVEEFHTASNRLAYEKQHTRNVAAHLRCNPSKTGGSG